MRERLVSYLAASGADVEREEIRWLIAEWGGGPPVLTLGPSLSWQRAGFAPLLGCLDLDRDGALSAVEIAEANERLGRADLDTDEVIDGEELRRAADGSALMPVATGHSLLVPLDETTDWSALAATLERLYGKQGGDVRSLAEQPADVTLKVDLASQENQPTGVSLVNMSSELGDAEKVVTATADVITLDLGADYVEFSAAQRAAGGQGDAGGGQLAIGAAIDGNPLMRLVDRDNDQRLTLRERQKLTGLLTALDRDGDGAVAAGELPMPIRVAVTLGPRVHELLATPVAAARAITPAEAAPTMPAWFASMDKNGDHDLSRGEFLGTTEQFRQFDADGDGLLSVVEAAKLDVGQ
jgi:Ca2+-binding EF-hand superfamily protein